MYGATPVCLKHKLSLEDNLFRTDLCFGDDEKKSPVYLTGEVTKQKLKRAGFKEISFQKILDEYQWQREGKDPNAIVIG